MSEKVSGYLLLLGGLIVIFVSLFSVYSVFTGASQPAALFNLSSISFDPTQALPADQKALLNSTPIEVMSGSSVSLLANITTHLILMSFTAGIGYKLSSLGIQLLRPIVVKLPATK